MNKYFTNFCFATIMTCVSSRRLSLLPGVLFGPFFFLFLQQIFVHFSVAVILALDGLLLKRTQVITQMRKELA